MLQSYPILSGTQTIGTAYVTQEGLYYRICCKCQLTGEVIYKIVINGHNFSEDLGVCVPTDGAFGVCTRIPTKRIRGDEFVFLAVPRHQKMNIKRVVVVEGSPFAYLSLLESAYLLHEDGQAWIAIDDQTV